jgi:hypothetical protein
MILSDLIVTGTKVQVVRRWGGNGFKAAVSSRNAFSLDTLRRVVN